jgi:pimeloyl-ACP methyl ester carboxylesterase
MTAPTEIRPAEVAESTVEVRGSRVRLLTAGTGDPVLYLHGSGDLGGWLPAHSALAADYTVIRPDLPGFNHSEPRKDVGTISDLAFRIWDLVDELGLETLRVVGSSLGGWLAADLATIEPSRISHLVLVDAAGLRPAGGHGVDMFVLSPAEILARTYHSQQMRDQMVAAAGERENDPDAFLLMLRNRAATAKLAWNPYFHDVRLPDRLHRVRARTLAVWGAEDQLVPVECGQRYAELIPDARLHTIAGCGHLPQLERTEEFLAAVTPFLAS